jgi:hypothetical protein
MGDLDTSAVTGVELRGYRRGTLSTDSWDQYVVPVNDRVASFYGRASTFRTPGRGAASQKLMAIHNAANSPVIVNVSRIRVDLLTQAPKTITTLPPIMRVHRFSVLPTNGNAITKTGLDTGGNTNTAVTLWGDASADAVSSTTTLTVTIPANSCLAQAYAPRQVAANTTPSSAAAYEIIDTITFLEDEPDIVVRPLQGICVYLDQSETAGNLTSDMWVGILDWEEYTQL